MKYIVDSILNYVKQENTNYAILLNGKWGSGKTFFWENELRKEIESVEIDGKKLKTIYVSLYGVNSLDEVSKKIFMESFTRANGLIQKVSESKWGGRITELGKMAVGFVKSLEVPGVTQALETEVNFENLLDFTDSVLCFDDLERANIDITDIMGYINNFVEHDGVKAIIISNEDEITKKLINQNIELRTLVSTYVLEKENAIQKDSQGNEIKELISTKILSLFDKTDEYSRIKEKLIGKTLTYEPDYKYIVENIIKQFTNERLKAFLEENLDTILNTFLRSDTNNIRILKQGLDDYALIYSRIIDEHKEVESEVLLQMLVFTLAVSFEIKSRAEDYEELGKISSSDDFMAVVFSAKLSGKKEITYFERFATKYFPKISYNFTYYKFIEILVHKGIFDEDVFEHEIKALINKQTDTTPVWERFIRKGYWELSDDEFDKAVQETYPKLVEGKVLYVLYFKAFLLFRDIIEKGLFKKSTSEVKAELLAGMEKSWHQSSYYGGLEGFLGGYRISPEDQDANEFKDKLISINNAKKEEKKAIIAKELISYLETDYNKFEYEFKEHFFYRPVFVFSSGEELFSKIVSLKNVETVRFSRLLQERYEVVGEYNDLSLDYEVLYDLKDRIHSYLEGQDMTLKLSYLAEIERWIYELQEKNISQVDEAGKEIPEC
ncbi:P-loop NTPase fold protein [Paenibacillus lautus]|uniref:P-loop NTPase fold protein n=1 Tax=Paenibacillus lautus TaxID=1401 RepID=UPI00384EF8E8